jgi:streptomycin 6-kinase
MKDDAKTEADERWRECLHLASELAIEMKASLVALARNDLRSFETSVTAQERLSAHARSLFHQPPRSVPAKSLQQLAAAGRQLQQQNRIYVAVLARAAQVCSALLSLYQDSPRGYSRDAHTPPPPPTWSCEV